MHPAPKTLSVFQCDSELITEFDESDLLEDRHESPLPVSQPCIANQQVVPLVRQSVLIGSLLEQLCSLYEPDKKKSHRLYFILCDQLSKLGIVSPVAYLQEFTSVRTQYKSVLYNIIQSSIVKLDAELVFKDEDDVHLENRTKSIADVKPLTIDRSKVFDFDVSRYKHEFIEMENLGTGGYGSVYHVKSKIDNQDYAMKKITLSSTLPLRENNDALLREVRVLATLHHTNIVRYHSAWIEHVHELVEAKSFQSKGSLERLALKKQGKKRLIQSELNLKSGDFSTYPHSKSTGSISSFPSRNVSFGDTNFLPCDYEDSQNGKLVQEIRPIKRALSKFWDENSDSSTSTQLSDPNKKMFSISPEQSDDEDFAVEDFRGPREKDCDKSVQFQMKTDEESDGVILTHGVRRDLDMRRVKSVVILKNTSSDGREVKLTGAFNDKTKRTHSLCTFDGQKIDDTAILKLKTSLHLSQPPVHGKLILFIQMQLCEMSLKQWLNARNSDILKKNETLREDLSLNIMKQILKALEFIHARDLIHRDVKPANIFLNNLEKPHILLGDFGLARTDMTSSNGHPMTPTDFSERNHHPFLYRKNSRTHTSGVGTTTYAAPEQLERVSYDFKVDMYSFGIVTYELWNCFGTAMERAKQMKLLRERSIPDEFTKKFPEQSNLLHNLLDHVPQKRYSAGEILRSSFFEQSKDMIIEEQRKQIQKLNDENHQLKLLVAKLSNN